MTLARCQSLFAIIASLYILWQIRRVVFLFLAAVVIAQTWLEEAVVHDILDHWKSE